MGRSGGNPFFVRELTRLRLAHVELGSEPPATVRDTVERRLARLSALCAELVAVAAVAGPRATRAAAAVLPGSIDVTAEIDAAVRARVLVRTPTEVRFAHDLFRETAAAGVPATQAVDLHSRIGAGLQQLGTGTDIGPARSRCAWPPRGPPTPTRSLRLCGTASELRPRRGIGTGTTRRPTSSRPR
jgi:hypothetical protein